MYFPEDLENTPLTLISNVKKKRVENEPKFCGLLNFKNTEINKQSHVKFWFNRLNMELSHICLAVCT